MKGHVEKVRGRREREWDGRKKKEKKKKGWCGSHVTDDVSFL